MIAEHVHESLQHLELHVNKNDGLDIAAFAPLHSFMHNTASRPWRFLHVILCS
jgi:hypothetical protein